VLNSGYSILPKIKKSQETKCLILQADQVIRLQ